MPDGLSALSAALVDRYRIEHELGHGGMAAVYLAHDVKHDRKVAIKVLRPELAAVLGAERFLQEIKTTANLQHPHILPLFDSGEADGFLYYVMPYVEGETLRDKLSRETQLGIDEALSIAADVAQALDYAHRQSVIHRDIKPENILLQEGRALVADFGIALAVREAGGNRLTETGLSLGTPQYMSPEQATGERMPDRRSDVYSLGAVLYEMLAGEPPVTGPTAQAVIAKLLTERPVRLRVVRDAVPKVVEAAVARALAKTPADRFAHAGEFAAALHGASAPITVPRIAPRWLLIASAGVVVLVGAIVLLTSTRAPRDPPWVLGRSQQVTAEDGLEIQPSLSPDGNLIAYAAGNAVRMRVYVRPMAGGRIIALSDDTSAVEHGPRWSPDGASLLFLSRGAVSVASALGGSSRAVVRRSTVPGVTAAAWSPDGSEIVFVSHDSLLVVPLAGGAERLVATEPSLHSCNWSPEGRWIACVQFNHEFVRPGQTFGNLAPSAILLFPATGGPAVRVVDAESVNQSPVWAPDAHWLYFLSSREGPRDVYAIRIESSGQPRGAPRRVTTGLGASSIALNASGTRMSYTRFVQRANIWSLPIAATSPDQAIPITSGSQSIESVRISRDGRWLLFDSDLRGNSDVYRMPVGGGEIEQLTSDPADEFAPDLSPNGRWVAYHSWRSGTRDIEIKAIDGDTIEVVTATSAQESYPEWSPDGNAILFYDQTRPFSILITRRNEQGHWTLPEVIARPGITPEWSPDGQTLAYVESEGEFPGHVMIAPTKGGPPRRLFVSATAPMAQNVLWSPDGRTLYFKRHSSAGQAEFWSADVARGLAQLLVRLRPDQESIRVDFSVDKTRLYFTLEDRQSDVYVAELLPR